MNRYNTTIALFVFLSLFSCRMHALTDGDYQWMPYKGNETLVFTSNLGDSDTIFCLKKDTIRQSVDHLNPFSGDFEDVAVFCKHTDSIANQTRYLENYLVKLQKSKDGRARLFLRLATKDATFYKLTGMKVDSLERQKPIQKDIQGHLYTDIYILEGEDWLNFKERYDYLTKVYWSKSSGLVRYDRLDGKYWELSRKVMTYNNRLPAYRQQDP